MVIAYTTYRRLDPSDVTGEGGPVWEAKVEASPDHDVFPVVSLSLSSAQLGCLSAPIGCWCWRRKKYLLRWTSHQCSGTVCCGSSSHASIGRQREKMVWLCQPPDPNEAEPCERAPASWLCCAMDIHHNEGRILRWLCAKCPPLPPPPHVQRGEPLDQWMAIFPTHTFLGMISVRTRHASQQPAATARRFSQKVCLLFWTWCAAEEEIYSLVKHFVWSPHAAAHDVMLRRRRSVGRNLDYIGSDVYGFLVLRKILPRWEYSACMSYWWIDGSLSMIGDLCSISVAACKEILHYLKQLLV